MNTKLIKKGKNLLLTSILAGIWLGNASAMAQQTRPAKQVSDAQVNAMVEALRKAAPQNRANDGMYSEWQVLPGTLAGWTKRCVGRQMTPAEFESDSAAARNTVACVVRREFSRVYASTGNETTAARNFACWWMTGTENGCASGVNAAYAQKVLGFYQQQARTNAPTEKPAATESKPAVTPTTEPTTEGTEEPAATPKPTSINQP